jgi:hypothetical protein
VYDKIHIQITVGDKLGKPLVGGPKMKIDYTILMDVKKIGCKNGMWEKVTHVFLERRALISEVLSFLQIAIHVYSNLKIIVVRSENRPL